MRGGREGEKREGRESLRTIEPSAEDSIAYSRRRRRRRPARMPSHRVKVGAKKKAKSAD